MHIKDCNGTVLESGDSVQLIKDLKVGGSSMTLKRGEVIKNIRVLEDEDEIECRIGKATLMLKPEFLRKKV
jgi:protein PhnA